jgi:hypothetical protein
MKKTIKFALFVLIFLLVGCSKGLVPDSSPLPDCLSDCPSESTEEEEEVAEVTTVTLVTSSLTNETIDINSSATAQTATFNSTNFDGDECTVDNTLPTGMTLSGAIVSGDLVCTISGTPTDVSVSTSYVITATIDSVSKSSSSVTLEVVAPRCDSSLNESLSSSISDVSGDGSSSFPFIICTPAQLALVLAFGASYEMILQADLDLDSLTLPLANSGSNFDGVFDGKGFTVSDSSGGITSSIFGNLASLAKVQAMVITTVNVSSASGSVVTPIDSSDSEIKGVFISSGSFSGLNAGSFVASAQGVIDSNLVAITISDTNSFCLASISSSTNIDNNYSSSLSSCKTTGLTGTQLQSVTVSDSANTPLLSSTFWDLQNGVAPRLFKTTYKTSVKTSLGTASIQ